MALQTRIGSPSILYDMPLFIDWELPCRDDPETLGAIRNICANLKTLNRPAYNIRLLGGSAGRAASIIKNVFNSPGDSVEQIDMLTRQQDSTAESAGGATELMHFVCGATNLVIDASGNAWGSRNGKMANLAAEKVFPGEWSPFISKSEQLTPYEASGQALPGFYFEKEAQAWLAAFKSKQNARIAEWANIDLPDLSPDFLNWMSPAFAAAIRQLLAQRSDLDEMLNGPDGEPRFLLWLWQYGLKEEESVRAHRSELEERLRDLASEPFSEDALPGYSRLLHAIWLAREDLRSLDTSTIDGQAGMLKWFCKYGGEELALLQIARNRPKGGGVIELQLPADLARLEVYRGQMMSRIDHGFIKTLLDIYRPRKIVEVGIAAGATTAFLLKQTGSGQRVYGVDIDYKVYNDPSRLTGNVVEEKSSQSEKERCAILRGKDIIERLDEIGGGIDFLILDTTHRMPGEVMHFLACYPYLKKGACVVLHDLSLNHRNNSHAPDKTDAYSTRVLLSAVGSGKKYVPATEYHTIGAFETDEWTKKSIESVFMALGVSWNYYHESIIPAYAAFFKDRYSGFCQKLFSQYVSHMQEVAAHRHANRGKK